MRPFIFLLLLLIGCATDPVPVTLPTKSINPDKTRYFFIGYTISDITRGNLYWQAVDGELPKKKEIIEFCHKTKGLPSFNDDELIVISLYEFKSKKDRDFFMAH